MFERRFSLEVGRAVRGPIVRALKDAFFHERFDYTIDDDMGWLSGTLYVSVRDPDEARLDEFMKRLTVMLNRWVSRP